MDAEFELTPAWLAERLGGNAADAAQMRLTATRFGEGLMGYNQRVTVDAPARPDWPRSLVVKMHSPIENNRRLGGVGWGIRGALGFYGAEVGFYSDIAQGIAVRVPHCHSAEIWDRGRRFALVLEDLGDAVVGNDIAGIDLAQAKSAMINLAGLHAAGWHADRDGRFATFMHADNATATILAGYYQDSLRAALLHYPEMLTGDTARFVGALGTDYAAWMTAAGRPHSLVHGDYRADNLLFEDGDRAVVVDWQTLSISSPGRDFGQLLGTSITSEDRRAHEQALLGSYHERLLALGVTGYDFAACLSDYHWGLFQGLSVVIFGLRGVTLTERGRTLFGTMLARATAAIADHLDQCELPALAAR